MMFLCFMMFLSFMILNFMSFIIGINLELLIALTFSRHNAPIFEEKKELFLFENETNLKHEFLYDNFKKKILLNFFVKILMCQI